MPKKRDIPGEMVEGQNYNNHETAYTNVRGSHRISTNNPSKCGREYTGKGTVKQTHHYMYLTEFLNKNQYGFIPQTSKTDANKALKYFVQEGFIKVEITAMHVWT